MATCASESDRALEEQAGRAPRRYLTAILALLTVAFIILAVRLFYVQIIHHERYLSMGRGAWSGTDPVQATRGDILSGDRVLLARSVFSYEIGIDPSPSLFSDSERLVWAIRTACDQLGKPAETRRRNIERAFRSRQSGGRYVRLGRGVDAPLAEEIRGELAKKLSRRELAALRRIPSSRRAYPRDDFLAQVIGFSFSDERGAEGIESSMDDFLTPRDGQRRIVRDAEQRLRIYYPENSDVSPIDGYDVVLTIDSRLQRILEDELEKGIAKHRAEAGLGVALDCRSGDVLAMASLPDYDPNEYHKYPEAEKSRRRTNRVIEYTYEPGSVIKPIIVSWALYTGVTWRDEPLWGGGKLHYHRVGRDSRKVEDVRDHGALTTEGAVVHSSNIGMSFLGLKLGRDRLIEALRRFGFARKTGILLPGEVPGTRRKTEDWSELYTSVSVSFGYAVTVTPIQLCSAFAAVINGGYLYRPRIVERLIRDGKELVQPTHLVGRVIDDETSRQMREILLRVVTEGTGRYLQIDGFRFGGKSGTADMDPLYTQVDYLASFEAFAPYEDPRVVLLVMIEKPRGRSHYGSTVSGSVVAAVLRRYFRVEADVATLSMRQ